MYLLSVCLRVTGATFFCCTGQLVLNKEEGLEESAWGRVMAPKYTDIQYAVCVPLEQVMVGCTVRVRVYNSSVPQRDWTYPTPSTHCLILTKNVG